MIDWKSHIRQTEEDNILHTYGVWQLKGSESWLTWQRFIMWTVVNRSYYLACRLWPHPVQHSRNLGQMSSHRKTLTPNVDVVVGVELVKFDMYEQQCKSLKKSSTAAAEQNSRQSTVFFYEMLHRSNKQHMTIRTRTAINRAELRIYWENANNDGMIAPNTWTAARSKEFNRNIFDRFNKTITNRTWLHNNTGKNKLLFIFSTAYSHKRQQILIYGNYEGTPGPKKTSRFWSKLQRGQNS